MSLIHDTQCGRSVVHFLVARVDIGVAVYEVMKPLCGRSLVQVLVVREDIGVVTCEAMTPQCGRLVLVVRVDIVVVTYEAMTSGSGPGCQSGYRSGDLLSYETPVW